jgi:hypothetical protein
MLLDLLDDALPVHRLGGPAGSRTERHPLLRMRRQVGGQLNEAFAIV